MTKPIEEAVKALAAELAAGFAEPKPDKVLQTEYFVHAREIMAHPDPKEHLRNIVKRMIFDLNSRLMADELAVLGAPDFRFEIVDEANYARNAYPIGSVRIRARVGTAAGDVTLRGNLEELSETCFVALLLADRYTPKSDVEGRKLVTDITIRLKRFGAPEKVQKLAVRAMSIITLKALFGDRG